MRNILFIIFVFAIVASCDSPLEVGDANRDIDFINDPRDGSKKFDILPRNIEFDLIHPKEIIDSNFRIINISKENQDIRKLRISNNNSIISNIEFPYQLNPSEVLEFNFIPIASKPGIYSDTIFIEEYNKPYLEINYWVPEIYGYDQNIENVNINTPGEIIIPSIYNASNKTIDINSITVEGQNNDFEIVKSPNFPIQIQAGEELKAIHILFKPKEVRNYSAKILIDAETELLDKEIMITGNGVD